MSAISSPLPIPSLTAVVAYSPLAPVQTCYYSACFSILDRAYEVCLNILTTMKLFLFLVTLIGMVFQYSLAKNCPSNQAIRRVFVVHRRINLSTASGCYLTHSGLLLQLANGRTCILEYATNGKATLSAVSPFYDISCWFKKCYIVDPYSNNGHAYWRAENKGVPLSRGLGVVSPMSARNQMQDLIGNQYNPLKRNSYHAMQKLRSFWGLPVHETTDAMTDTSLVCSCVTRLSTHMVPPNVRQIFQSTKKECSEAQP